MNEKDRAHRCVDAKRTFKVKQIHVPYTID